MYRPHDTDSANPEAVEHDIVMLNIDGEMIEITDEGGEENDDP